MRSVMLFSMLVATPFFFAACDHRQPIGGGFELKQSTTWNPDGHPGIFLYYQGKEAWHQISWGYPYSPKDFCHGDIFVFESPVPEADGYNNYGISPQLYAIRASGPPVLISQRIMGMPLKGDRLYTVENTVVTRNGVGVIFDYISEDDQEAMRTNEVSWVEIAGWVREAEGSAAEVRTPLGNYRLLTTKPPSTPVTGANGSQSGRSETNRAPDPAGSGH
jgi:hypothetical protein